MSLFYILLEYSESDFLPMHMPGHKRRAVDTVLPYGIDITEIDGFDNLHNRQGVLKELADRCAALRNAGCAFPLVGGSTLGVLTAVYALTKPGDTVIIARGCHKSVYHACEICALNVKYILNGLMKGHECDISNTIVTNQTIGLNIIHNINIKEYDCNSCGLCYRICPVKVNPKKIMDKKVLSKNCIDCGLCSYICPCYINLRRFLRSTNE